MRRMPEKGERYKHWKGCVYEVISAARHADGRLNPVVVYRAVTPTAMTEVWWHFREDFLAMGAPGIYRFTKIEVR